MKEFDDIEFWTDEYFFSSQDPLIRETEKRHHSDTGLRIPITLGRTMDVVKKAVVEDVAKGGYEETRNVYVLEKDFSKN